MAKPSTLMTPEECLLDAARYASEHGIPPSSVGHEYVAATCLLCGYEDPDYEPTDAEIFAHYGQTKEYP